MRGIFRDLNNQLNFKNITPSPREVVVLQLPPEGIEKQMEDKIPDSSDSNSSPKSDKNLDDNFQDVPPPTAKDKGKFKVGSSLSPAKKRMKQHSSYVEEQPVHKTGYVLP
ncbi:uncharacterized protein LOC129888325 [Solanum dulcamara]|uniref:uncharacterized protein LOC129888325 n=1 Tax=Solanum dulcamara TaxID=45834 RepID=UPI002484E147|nr:uncharacterized protein LOC129888325 [Solanum dulcamara]